MLSRFSWRVYASTQPLALSPSSPGKLSISLCLSFLSSLELSFLQRRAHSFYSLHSFCPASFSPSCSFCSPKLSFISRFGDLDWWLFPFVKGGSGVLANCSLCGIEATFSHSAGPVCPSFSAEACSFLLVPRWSWQHQQICHFLSPLRLIALSFVHCPFLRPSFYLTLSGTSGRNYPFSPPFLSRHVRCVLSRFCCNEHSFLFPSYLSRIGRIDNCLCSAYHHPTQDIWFHSALPSQTLRSSPSDDYFCIYDLWSRRWEVARLLVLHGLLICAHRSEGVG